MNLNFNLVWFEDEDEVIESYEPVIRGLLAQYNLVPNIIKYGSDQYSSKVLATADLILADYDLGTKVTSVDIVDHIRGNKIITDVLFYSSQEVNMINSIKNASMPMEGVFYEKRDYIILPAKIDKLIQRIIRRSQTVENLRGIIMEYTAIFDKKIYEHIQRLCVEPSMLSECLKHINTNIAQDFNKKLCKSCVNAISEKECDHSKGYSRKEISNPLEVGDFDSAVKCRILANLLKKINKPKYKDFFKEYDNEIIQYRNAFAHEQSDENRIYIKQLKAYENVDEKLFLKIRASISKYMGLLNEIKDINIK